MTILIPLINANIFPAYATFMDGPVRAGREMCEQDTEHSTSIKQFRDEAVICCGRSGENVVNAILTICEGGIDSKWIRL